MNRARKIVGRLSFVGAGPGDPELLCRRAVELIGDAEIVYADADVPESIVALIVGDHRPVTPATHPEASRAALAAARTGSIVVRLVNGDPFTSDEVVREVGAAARTAVPVDVVPAVTAAIGATTYAGVPIGGTHTVADVRGARAADIDALTSVPGTLVLTVNGEDAAALGEQLVSAGLKPDTPIAIISRGTTTSQQTFAGTVGEMGLAATGMSGPVVIAVGKAVAQREKLGWWESRPLYGWRVLVPRTKDQAGEMSVLLRAYGAVPDEVPTIAVEPPRTPTQMERAVKGLVTGRYEWVVFTSTNAVRAVWDKFAEFGLDARAFAGVKIACVGESTADAVRSHGIRPELVPTGDQSSEGLLAEFPDYDEVLDPIDRVLLPRADIATETLSAGLTERGWAIDDVTAYRTVRAAPPAAHIRDAIKSGGFQAVCFTSSSTVRNLVGIAGKPHAKTVVAVIGPHTAETAAEFGLRVDVQAETATVTGLVQALADFAVQRAEEQREKAASASAAVPRFRSQTGVCGRSRNLDGMPLPALPGYPTTRPRRLRTSAAMRRLTSDVSVRPSDLILPMFVREGLTEPRPIASMPGVLQHSAESLRKAAHDAVQAGVGGVMLFGVPAIKDSRGSGADDPAGVLNLALTSLRGDLGDDTVVMADLCLDEFTDHGHCGVLDADGRVDNDATLDRYVSMGVAQARAGAHVVGTSGMMDGQVGAVRAALDADGCTDTAILAYSAKYASAFFGPFREAVDSSLTGDRLTYQQDPSRDAREALAEVALDVAEGADVVMVKPALPYLDILRAVADASPVPVAAYQVSGEYAMVEAAAERGWLDRRRTALETLTAIRRAGAGMILTYWAAEAATWLA